MLTEHFIDATGLIALTLTMTASIGSSDRTMFRASGWASAIWALNSLLIGAYTAAALSVLGVGRQVSAFKLMDRPTRTKTVAFGILLIATLLLAALTWNGPASLFPVVGSLIASYAMLHMRGAALRWAMVLVSSLWMGNAIAFDSWWQMTANGLAGAAAAIGAWRTRSTAVVENGCHACGLQCACSAQ